MCGFVTPPPPMCLFSTMHQFPDDAGAFMTDEGPAFFEYYDLNSDPWQRQNNFTSLAPEAAAALKAQLDAFKTCKGAGCVLEY